MVIASGQAARIAFDSSEGVEPHLDISASRSGPWLPEAVSHELKASYRDLGLFASCSTTARIATQIFSPTRGPLECA